MRFKDTELPPVENSRKNYLATLRTKTVQPELEAARRYAACNSCNVNTEGDEDDIADE
jgi:porphobilinogen deaminase